MNCLRLVVALVLFTSIFSVSAAGALDLASADQVKSFLTEVGEKTIPILSTLQKDKTIEVSISDWNEPFGIPKLKVKQGILQVPVAGTSSLLSSRTRKVLVSEVMPQISMQATLEFLGISQSGSLTVLGTLTEPGRYFIFSLTRDVKLNQFPVLEADLVKDLAGFLEAVSGIKEIGARDIDFVYDRKEKRFLVKTTITINNKDIDTSLFQAKDAQQQNGWNLMMVFPEINLSALIQKIFPIKLDEVVLKNLAMVISHRGIGGAINEQIYLVQPTLTAIYDDPTYELAIQKGMNVFTSFAVEELGSFLSGQLKKIGLSGHVAIQGAIGGLKPSELEMSLYAMLPLWKMPEWVYKSFPFMESIPDTRSTFFVKVVPAALEFGVSQDVWVRLTEGEPKSKTSAAVETVITTDGSFKLMVATSLDRWHKPLNIPGLCIEDVVFKVGVEADLAGSIGVGGRTYINGREVGIAGDVAVAWRGEVAYPKSGAFRGELSRLSLQDLASIGNTMYAMETGNWKPWDHPSTPINPSAIPDFELRDVKFEFVTPGAADPDLGFKQDGFAVRGGLFAFNTMLGNVNCWITKTNGGAIQGSIHDFSYQGVDFKGALIDIALNFNELPHFFVKTGFDAFFTKFDMDWNFSRTAFGGHSLIKIADLYEAEVKAVPDQKLKDYVITAYMKTDFQEKLQKLLLESVVKLQQELLRQHDLLKGPRAAVDEAQKLKDGALKKITDLNLGALAGQGVAQVQKQLNAEKQKVNAAIGTAEKLINDLNGEISKLKSALDKVL